MVKNHCGREVGSVSAIVFQFWRPDRDFFLVSYFLCRESSPPFLISFFLKGWEGGYVVESQIGYSQSQNQLGSLGLSSIFSNFWPAPLGQNAPPGHHDDHPRPPSAIFKKFWPKFLARHFGRKVSTAKSASFLRCR